MVPLYSLEYKLIFIQFWECISSSWNKIHNGENHFYIKCIFNIHKLKSTLLNINLKTILLY